MHKQNFQTRSMPLADVAAGIHALLAEAIGTGEEVDVAKASFILAADNYFVLPEAVSPSFCHLVDQAVDSGLEPEEALSALCEMAQSYTPRQLA